MLTGTFRRLWVVCYPPPTGCRLSEDTEYQSTAILKNNYHGEGYCVCCMNYKGKEVEGCELKLNRLTADKKRNSGKLGGRRSAKLVKKVTVCLPL